MLGYELKQIHLVLDYPEYRFEIDEYVMGEKQVLIAHLRFFKFSLSVYKRVLREWKAFRTAMPAPLFAVRDDGDEDTWVHFVSALGFKPTGLETVCNNGVTRQLYISR